MRPVDIFHIGPQKSATTWLYRCLLEHPEIACPPKDKIHYMDMFYAKGRNWYETFFKKAKLNQKLFDPTPSYIRSPLAPERIYAENPKAKIIVCLRNPIDRAFSHYWHEKKKRKYNFNFSEFLSNYDLFSSWIETGFYALHLNRYFQFFQRNQILCQNFSVLQCDPAKFLKEFLDFVAVNSDFRPSVLKVKINAAGDKKGYLPEINKFVNRVGKKIIPGIWSKLDMEKLFSAKSEYLKGIPDDIKQQLQEIYLPEIEKLEKLLEIDLSLWKS